ncbi:hypothetical protein MFLAVUS_001199 [Mucor flavus]|uniref:Phospholipid/glycerol acyltransferase domain-containing protein n=1 Tax=Mucor flavus TaxID=439312 RepID=A0ABP9YLT9_9FUNG
MRMWSQNLVALVQWFAPSDIVMTFDQSCGELDDIIRKDSKTGDITSLVFPKRIVAIANHQIYADWIYIWCIAHLAGAHGVVKIILKDSLKNLPVYGLVNKINNYGMRFFDFIFLKRKLALDQETIESNLERSKKSDQPMWLVLFPEGTVVSPCTRKRSKEFAEKNNLRDNRYTLLPRSTGLRLCTTTLDDSVEYMYDFTIGYSGVGPNEIPEQVYTIQSIFFFKHFPKKIHVQVRRFKIDSIPKAEEEFNQWVHERWIEKDELMGHFYKYGSFPPQDRTIEVPIKLRNNSILDLAHIWVFLVPYLLLVKKIMNLAFTFKNAAT